MNEMNEGGKVSPGQGFTFFFSVSGFGVVAGGLGLFIGVCDDVDVGEWRAEWENPFEMA